VTGKVINQAVIPHACNPGWRWKPITDESGILPLVPGGVGGYYGIPPTPREFPKGTVWRCTCGQTWVSLGAPDEYAPGFCGWRRERRLGRWLRERREAR
jgi:hypothetical protein